MQYASIILSFIFCIFCHAFLPVFYCIASSKKLSDKQFIKKYGAVTDGLHCDNLLSRHWNLLIFIRWSLVSLVLVSLRDFNFI